MKKQYQSALAAVLLAVAVTAQQQVSIRPCDTYAAMEQVFANDPEARDRYEKTQAFLEKQLHENNITAKSSAPEYTIPVVFHVLHTGGSENISDASLIAALDWVNKDFARGHADAITVAPPFEPLYIPSDIKFMLAKKDPNGNPTTGIVHTYDKRTTWDRNNNTAQVLFNGITWNPTKYLNIIIVKDIVSAPGQQGVVVGYTYKPGTWTPGSNPDAIVYNYSYLSGTQIRSMTHEIGHWLNLSHTFGDTNNAGVTCGDDGVTDTPPTKGNFSSCPSSLSGNTCGGSGGQQNVENFMDYSSCPKNFTQGQTARMRNALAASAGGRNNLSTPANLAFTDVNGTGPCCPPIAEFLSDNQTYTVCAGGSLMFKNFSYNGAATSISWVADNGATVSSPTGSNTNVTFPVPGVSNVTLTMSNSLGVSTRIRQVTVLDNTPGIVGPVIESFEDFGLPVGWVSDNKDIGSKGWEQSYPMHAYHGSACFFIEPSSGPNQSDVLETPVIDMQASPEKKITFAYTYARKSNSHQANFIVEYTADCGGTWLPMLTLDANVMQSGSGGVTTDFFNPTSESEWKVVDFASMPQSAAAWNSVKNSPNLKLRFTFKEITGGGNNFYFDAINLPGEANGIDELSSKYRVNLYPNPAKGQADLKFTLQQSSQVGVTVMNVLGAEVMRVDEHTVAAGDNHIAINPRTSLTPGVYFVNLSVNGSVVSQKLIVE